MRAYLKLSITICLFAATLASAQSHKLKPQVPGTAVQQTLTGTVSDSMCGAKHMMPDKSAADCAKECAKDGDYALVVGDKVYTLKGHKAELDKLAGAKATVTGAVKGDTIEVATVAAPKKS